MAKQINTRILLKYDTLANWQASAFNGTDATKYLKAGELAIVTLGSDVETNHPTNASNQHPLLFKVGDGTHKFDDLAWASALAADVYDWAKKPQAEFEAWVKTLVPVTVVDEGAGKFVTDVSHSTTDNGRTITITRSDVALADISDKEKIALSADLGDVTKLTTTAKTAVGAINELDAEIGDLSKLDTALESPANLVTAINKTLAAVEAGGTGSVVTVGKDDTSSSETTYTVYQGGKTVGGEGATIEVPKVATGSANGTIAYGTTEVAVKGLASAAYVTVDSLNNAASGYVTELQTALEEGSVEVAKADSAVYAQEAGYVSNKLTIKVGGGDPKEYDGREAIEVDVDTAISSAIGSRTTYTNTEIDNKVGAVLGTSTDAATANTVYGAKAAAAAAQNDATIAKTKIETFLGTITPGGSQDIIDTLTEINTYVGEHGEEFAALSEKVTKIENGTTATTAGDLTAALETEIKGYTVANATKAADADKLGGQDPSYYATATSVTDITKSNGVIDTKIAGKADKVSGAVNGNLAALDANGNLTDSGKKAADFALADDLHIVATSGQYGDLENRPTLGALAAKDKIVEGDIEGTISNTKISGLGSLAVKNTITENDIAGNISVDKVTGAVDTATFNSFTETIKEIATTGSIYDVAEGSNVSTGNDAGDEYLIFYCGTATAVI